MSVWGQVAIKHSTSVEFFLYTTTNFFGAPSSGPRQTWTNQIANQVVEPLQLFYPRSLHDSTDKQSIAAILSGALATGCAVKAAGSGHSYSDVATTPDFLINTHGFCRVASEPSPIAGQLSPSALRSPHTITGSSGHRNIISQLLSRFKVSFELVVALLNKFPGLVPFALTESMASLVDASYINKSFDIYNLGLNQDAGFAAEVGFSLQDDAGNYTTQYFKAAIDRIHQIGQRARQQGEQYQTSPFSLRFVKASGANLSMMNGRNTAMIEMDMLTGTYAGPDVMYRYETRMYSLGGRPHWGLDFDCITGNNDLLRKMYTKLDNWLGVYRQFNALGTFNSSFTDRVGFTAFE